MWIYLTRALKLLCFEENDHTPIGTEIIIVMCRGFEVGVEKFRKTFVKLDGDIYYDECV